MNRTLFTFVVAASLLISLAAAVVWASSYRVAMNVCHRASSGRLLILRSQQGLLILERVASRTSRPAAHAAGSNETAPGKPLIVHG